jgi:ferredoxin
MATARDMLDELIDMQEDWQKVSNPLSDIANSLADPSQTPEFNPADYKGRPRANSVYCQNIAAKRTDLCTRCLDACPVDAIEIGDRVVKVTDNCRECGLCIAQCPTEAFQLPKLMSKQLYDKIARAASTYERCYVTCTRALGRVPQPNELLLPCVGVLPAELWFSLLVDYDNIEVYLPVGICDRCRTTTGEEVYTEAISQAEEWSGYEMGLEVDEAAMTHEQSRAYKRGQFVNNMARAGQRAMMATAPGLLGAKAVAERIRRHAQSITDMQHALEEAVGDKTSAKRRHILTQPRKLLLTTIQQSPALANVLHQEAPVCDPSLCVMCGDCANACVLHACDLDQRGHFSVVAPYCVGCGACVAVCEEGALRMEPVDPAELVVPDPHAAEAARQRALLQEAKERGREKLSRYMGALEQLADQ